MYDKNKRNNLYKFKFLVESKGSQNNKVLKKFRKLEKSVPVN